MGIQKTLIRFVHLNPFEDTVLRPEVSKWLNFVDYLLGEQKKGTEMDIIITDGTD